MEARSQLRHRPTRAGLLQYSTNPASDATIDHQNMTRTEAWTIVCEFIQSEGLRKHALAARGVSEEIRRAILSHADFTGVPRVTPLEKALFACDELAGFITACSYVKPGKSVHEVDPASVRKKMKDKGFARAVSRDDIVNGAASMGLDLNEHIAFCLAAMQAKAGELGLAGVKP